MAEFEPRVSHALPAFCRLCLLASLPEIPSNLTVGDSGALCSSPPDPRASGGGVRGWQPEVALGPGLGSHWGAAGSALLPPALFIVIISFQHAAKSFPQRSHKPSSLKFKGLYLNNGISLRKETGEVSAVDKFSAMCGSEQMSVGFGGCGGGQGDAPGEGSGSSPLPLIPTRARRERGSVEPRVLGRALGATCGEPLGAGGREA